MFKIFVCVSGIECNKILYLDIPTRWNSTFLLLKIAKQYRKTFDTLGEEGMQYVHHFEEDKVRSG